MTTTMSPEEIRKLEEALSIINAHGIFAEYCSGDNPAWDEEVKMYAEASHMLNTIIKKGPLG